MSFVKKTMYVFLIICSLLIIRSLFIPSYSLNGPDYFKSRIRKISIDKITATGFNVKAPSGKLYMVTNFHFCIWSQDGTFETLNSGSKTKQRILGISPKNDLCIATPFNDKYFNIEDNDKSWFFKTGGFPSITGDKMAFSTGIFLGKEERPLILKEPPLPSCFPGTTLLNSTSYYLDCIILDDTVETTMYSYPGTSGSPVLNINNKLVGIINSAGEMNRAHFVQVRKLLKLIEGFERSQNEK